MDIKSWRMLQNPAYDFRNYHETPKDSHSRTTIQLQTETGNFKGKAHMWNKEGAITEQSLMI